MTEKKIKEFLINRGDYNEVFDFHIKRLYKAIQIANKAEKDIVDNGVRVNVSKPETPVYQMNHSVSVLTNINKDIRAYSKLLGLSPFDLKELEIDGTKDESFTKDDEIVEEYSKLKNKKK